MLNTSDTDFLRTVIRSIAQVDRSIAMNPAILDKGAPVQMISESGMEKCMCAMHDMPSYKKKNGQKSNPLNPDLIIYGRPTWIIPFDQPLFMIKIMPISIEWRGIILHWMDEAVKKLNDPPS